MPKLTNVSWEQEMSGKSIQYPKWVNVELSEKYAKLIPKGESYTLEFKKIIERPERLTKEIAAFATSVDGVILIGVDDKTKEVVGIPNGKDNKVRDAMIQKLEGYCSGSAKPPINVSFEFLLIENLVVLAMIIPKGPEPVYYNTNNVPYMRFNTEARPADPFSVYKFFEQHFTGVIDPEKDISCKLVNYMRDILIVLDQAKHRQVNPWSDLWKSELGEIANELREIAISDVAETYKFDDDLNQLAKTLYSLSKLVESTRVGPEELIVQVRDKVQNFRDKYLRNVQLSDENYHQILEIIFKVQKKLNALLGRSDQLISDLNDEELMEVASGIGKYLLTVCYYDINSFLNGKQEDLKNIGTKLNLIETERLHDNVQYCLTEIVEKLATYKKELDDVVESIKSIN